VVRGRLNKQIAGDLGVSEITVKVRRAQVMRKMGARTLVDLVRMYDRLQAGTLDRTSLLLRAVNVGGTGKLPMRELVAMCEDAGFSDTRTYIASGNVVFRSGLDEAAVRGPARRLKAYAGKPVGVLVRSASRSPAWWRAIRFRRPPATVQRSGSMPASPPIRWTA
jgi:hypothetical protein